MSEIQQEDAKPKRKPTKRRKAVKRAAAPRAEKSASPYPGLTAQDCCKACSADGCAISGKTYCAHPGKGGLQGTDMQDKAALGRLNEARKVLKMASLDR